MDETPVKLENNKATFIFSFCKCSHTSWASPPADLLGVLFDLSVFIACFLAVLKPPFTSAETLDPSHSAAAQPGPDGSRSLSWTPWHLKPL